MAGNPTLLYLVKQLELSVRARLDELMRPVGLTALQYTALTVLERHGDISSAQLARNSFVTAQTMADMVLILEDRGLIERHRDPSDKRRLLIALTPAGRAILADRRPHVAAIEKRMTGALSTSDAALLRRFLMDCRSSLET
ncbi:MarR family winged helix-turn-helix transcriptional regulator [Aeromicrobium sp.]|uniref:MarR family winged helix-turn-helix transcriptional regulator n=1 Tax=Aeromicrobium sp. TaxID=1871063 RepID=UPI002FC9A63C